MLTGRLANSISLLNDNRHRAIIDVHVFGDGFALAIFSWVKSPSFRAFLISAVFAFDAVTFIPAPNLVNRAISLAHAITTFSEPFSFQVDDYLFVHAATHEMRMEPLADWARSVALGFPDTLACLFREVLFPVRTPFGLLFADFLDWILSLPLIDIFFPSGHFLLGLKS